MLMYVLLALLVAAVLAYGFALVRVAIAKRVAPGTEALALGAVVAFLDTLGIGSFAPTTAWFKFRRMVPDRLIPGTLNAGHTLPTIAQAFIYTSIIEVDVLTLFAMIAMGTLMGPVGALLSAPLATVVYVLVRKLYLEAALGERF